MIKHPQNPAQIKIIINIMLFYYFKLFKLIYTDITGTRYTYD